MWKLFERLRLVKRCSHCDEYFWPWQGSPVNGFLKYCRACFDYYTRDEVSDG